METLSRPLILAISTPSYSRLKQYLSFEWENHHYAALVLMQLISCNSGKTDGLSAAEISDDE